jgi:hypothetical protein
MKFTLLEGGGERSIKPKPKLTLIEGYKNMIKLNYMIFRNEPFKGAMIKIQNSDISHDAHYKVKRYMDEFKKHGNLLDEGTKSILNKYCALDGKGVPIISDKEVDGKLVKGYEWLDETAANEEFKKLYETEFVIEQNKLFSHDINNARMTPMEWEAVAPFLYDPSNG